MLLHCAFREHEELFFLFSSWINGQSKHVHWSFPLEQTCWPTYIFYCSSWKFRIFENVLTTFISEESPKIKSFHSMKFCMNLAKLHIRLFGRLPSQIHIFTSWYCGTILSTYNVNVRDLRHFCLYLSVAIISTLLCSILSHF